MGERDEAPVAAGSPECLLELAPARVRPEAWRALCLPHRRLEGRVEARSVAVFQTLHALGQKARVIMIHGPVAFNSLVLR